MPGTSQTSKSRTHHCSKEKEIADMQRILKTMEPVVMGSGPKLPGLNVTVPILAENVSKLTENVGALTVSVTNLLEYQAKEEATREQKELDRKKYIEKREIELQEDRYEFDRKMKKRNYTLYVIGTIIVVLTFIVTISSLKNDKKDHEIFIEQIEQANENN